MTVTNDASFFARYF